MTAMFTISPHWELRNITWRTVRQKRTVKIKRHDYQRMNRIALLDFRDTAITPAGVTVLKLAQKV